MAEASVVMDTDRSNVMTGKSQTGVNPTYVGT